MAQSTAILGFLAVVMLLFIIVFVIIFIQRKMNDPSWHVKAF